MIAFFDCFSGVSGDMLLGALLDAGAALPLLEDVIQKLGLGADMRVTTSAESRGHLGGTRLHVELTGGRARTASELLAIVEGAGVADGVRGKSLDALRRLVQAESRLHQCPPEELHLHELSGADTLLDIVGTFTLLASLEVTETFASALPATRGWTAERLPLPAPATLEVLAGTGAVLEPSEERRELITPTGAAILAALARFERPAMQLSRVGYGLGSDLSPSNALRVWLGELTNHPDAVSILETNIDDMPPSQLATLAAALMEDGALDVSITPVVMKKGRPAHLLSVMCAEEREARRLAGKLLKESTTLGVRLTQAERIVADRKSIDVTTAYGPVSVKLKYVDGLVVEAAPEHGDCERAARVHGVRLRSVVRAAERAAWETVDGTPAGSGAGSSADPHRAGVAGVAHDQT